MARKKKTRRDPQKIVQQFLSSNTTQKRFCRKHNLALSTLQYWLHQHRHQQSSHEPPVFLPVEVSAEPPANGNSPACEIEYPNGVRIRLSEPVSIYFLNQLVQVRGL